MGERWRLWRARRRYDKLMRRRAALILQGVPSDALVMPVYPGDSGDPRG